MSVILFPQITTQLHLSTQAHNPYTCQTLLGGKWTTKYPLCHVSFYERTHCHSVVLAMWVVKIRVKLVIAIQKQGKDNNLSIKLMIFYHQCTIYTQHTYTLSFSSLSLKRDTRLATMPVIYFSVLLSVLMSLLQYLPSCSPLISKVTIFLSVYTWTLITAISSFTLTTTHISPSINYTIWSQI